MVERRGETIVRPQPRRIGRLDWRTGTTASIPKTWIESGPSLKSSCESDGRNWADEYRFRRADGSYIYILDRGRKFYDESGAPVLIAGAMDDHHRTRVQAEEALRESEERYRLLTELSPDGVVIAGADGTIHLANPSMLRMLGAAPEQVIGRNLLDFIEPEYLGSLPRLPGRPDGQQRAGDTGRGSVSERGWPELSRVRSTPCVLTGRGSRSRKSLFTTSARRKQAEAERERLLGEIEAERDRLRQILEQMPIGVAIAEAPSGRTIFHNLRSGAAAAPPAATL